MPSTASSRTERPILFFDSGVGGLAYLDRARTELPLERLVYLADTEHFPYGERAPEDVRRIVLALMDRALTVVDPKVVVVACNTASVAALAALRERYAVPFIGTVPAVKPAAMRSPSHRIALVATRGTVHAEYLSDLIAEFAGGCSVLLVPAGETVRFVEERYLDAPAEERREVVRRALAPLEGQRVDTVVLACTHFLHLHDEFHEALGEGVEVIDSLAGVVRQLGRVLEKEAVAARTPPTEPHLLWVSGRTAAAGRYERFARHFGLSFAGELAGEPRADGGCR